MQPGSYNFGASVDTNNLGPFVSLRGPGKAACTIYYHGSGASLTCHNPHVPTIVPGFLGIEGWAGVIDGFTIDGTNASAGAIGLDYGDNEGGTIGAGHDLMIQHFNLTGSIGLNLINRYWWTEKTHIRALLLDNTTNVLVSQTGGSPSFGYNDWLFEIFAETNQDGYSQTGGTFYNGRLIMRGNFVSGAGNTGAAIRVDGSSTSILYSQLTVQAETSGSSTGHQTIHLSNSGVIRGCEGILRFQNSTANWTTASGVSASSSTPPFAFHGIALGDTKLNPASASPNAPFTQGAENSLGAPGFYSAGTAYLNTGDAFDLGTLTGNLSSIVFAGTNLSPCVKIFRVQQAASGGPYTITWPNGASNKVVWPGGSTPVMSTAANAVDIYVLRTLAQSSTPVIWYGQALQAMA